MKDVIAAGRYARALFEMARASGKDQDVEDALETFSKALLTAPDVEKVFRNPELRTETKIEWIGKVYPSKSREAEVDTLLRKFYSLLIKKGRFDLIHEIAREYKTISDKAQGESTAFIQSAVPLSAEKIAAIVSRLERFTGDKIVQKHEVRPELIGGVLVRIGNRVFDGSVKHKIDRLKKELITV